MPALGARKPGTDSMSPEFADVRKALDALTPEQRQRFLENFKRWASLPPEERKALADHEIMRRRKMNQTIEDALHEAGLELDPERQGQFARRYAEERRKVEEQLRKEMEEKRGPLLKEILTKLQGEFSTAPRPAPVPTP